MKKSIFISYARSDSSFILKLSKELQGAGIDIWLDQNDIGPGDNWDISIEKALAESSTVLVVLSPASVLSQHVLDEVSYALDEGKKVIPLLSQPCNVPFRWRRLQRIDFSKDFANGLRQLIATLTTNSSSSYNPLSQTASQDNSEKNRKFFSGKYIFLAIVGILLIFVGAWIISHLARPVSTWSPAFHLISLDSTQVDHHPLKIAVARVDLDSFSTQAQAINWNDARQHCEDLTHGLISDWRLPTIQELEHLSELIDSGQKKEILGASLISLPYCCYWSSTLDPQDQSFMLGYDFSAAGGGARFRSRKSSRRSRNISVLCTSFAENEKHSRSLTITPQDDDHHPQQDKIFEINPDISKKADKQNNMLAIEKDLLQSKDSLEIKSL